METYIYGASDDLVELDGHFSEEIGVYNEDEGFYLALSNGVVIKGIYNDNGEWKFEAVKGEVKIIPAIGEDGEHEDCPKYSSYSDIVVVEGDVKWALLGTKFVK